MQFKLKTFFYSYKSMQYSSFVWIMEFDGLNVDNNQFVKIFKLYVTADEVKEFAGKGRDSNQMSDIW